MIFGLILITQKFVIIIDHGTLLHFIILLILFSLINDYVNFEFCSDSYDFNESFYKSSLIDFIRYAVISDSMTSVCAVVLFCEPALQPLSGWVQRAYQERA